MRTVMYTYCNWKVILEIVHLYVSDWLDQFAMGNFMNKIQFEQFSRHFSSYLRPSCHVSKFPHSHTSPHFPATPSTSTLTTPHILDHHPSLTYPFLPAHSFSIHLPMAGNGNKRKKSTNTLRANNNEVKDGIERAKKARISYLVTQAPALRKFLGAETLQLVGDDKNEADKGKSGTARRRMTEKEEDRMMLEKLNVSSAEEEEEGIFLQEQPVNIKGKMRDYQLEGLNFLIGLYEHGISGILADEMGLGKTLQSISFLAFLRLYKGINGPHLIIVPKSTLGNWMNEIDQWCPDINVVRFHGNQEERKSIMKNALKPGGFDVCVTSYEIVTRERSFLQKISWRILIIDEAHRIKNEQSILSQVVRAFTSQSRLLVTGTPLQNNLHELWALLNFLLPDVFSSSEDFENMFSSVEQAEGDEETQKQDIVNHLHAVLRPFLIRRLKAEVERDLPPKTETVLFTKLSPMQLELYRNLLKKDIDAINGRGGDKVRLLNILMQLRKCANHPYLFDGVEDRSLDPFGDHVITNCGKLSLLDKLLVRLKEQGHRVLIFSQMTRLLDILEDYCTMRKHEFCRIDGSTDGELRDTQISDFNSPDSTKFIFLLSTRAGGLGINLASADTVILYDSDWNPQMDLQAMDRAHRIGQKRPVNVYRLITESSVEERILRKAMQKLRLDTLVIQQGRLTAQKKHLHKDELLDMIRFGADSFFKTSTAEDLNEEDLDRILQRGQQKTTALKDELGKINSGNLNMLDFKVDAPDAAKSLFDFEGINYRDAQSKKSDNFILDVGKRSRTRNYDEGTVYRDGRADKGRRTMRYPKEPNASDYQLFDMPRLRRLFEKEREAVDEYNYLVSACGEGEEPPPPPENLLDKKDQLKKEALLKDGFTNWNRREFHAFIRGCEKYGRRNIAAICTEIGLATKSPAEVKTYSEAFWKLGPYRIDNWLKYFKQITDGEKRIEKHKDMEVAVDLKCKRYKDPWKNLVIIHAGNKSKAWIDEEDRWLICMVWKLGYGRWDEIKLEARKEWRFRFDWYLRSRSAQELKRRADVLIRGIQKENEEIAASERAEDIRKKSVQRRKEKSAVRSSMDGAQAEGGNISGRKRAIAQARIEPSFPGLRYPKLM